MKRIMLALLTVFMCLSFFPQPVKAEEKISDDGYLITITYDVTSTNRTGKWDMYYHDSWFLQSAEGYNHDLARLSLGMALSAFRPKTDPAVDGQPDAHLIDFLHQCQFKDLRTDDYDKNPSLYTVATVMGRKTLRDEEGEFELIAVGVCGGGYKNEWMSNFSCGDDMEHLGFRSAAEEVYDRLFGYISRNNMYGKRLKVWVSGFSRAAAISNIFAKMVTDSEVFESRNVFAYTFATPRTTRDEYYARYLNIYNICGKMDPVPHVTFADWGFDRYGTTLYTPAQQTDSDYFEKFYRANSVCEEHYGMPFWNNAEWDTKLRVLLNYLLKIAPTSEIYAKHLQDRVVRLWGDKSLENIMTVLMEIAEDKELINESNKSEANSLLTFVAYSVLGYATRTSLDSVYVAEYASLVSNLAHEHTPEVYLCWMFSSDDPKEIFSSTLDYIRCVISGDTDVAVLTEIDGQDWLVTSMDDEGYFTTAFEYRGEVFVWREECGDIFMGREKDNTVIMIPKDRTYKIVTRSNKNQTVETRCDSITVGYTSSQVCSVRETKMKKGEFEQFVSPAHSIIEGDFNEINGNTFDIMEISRGTTSELALILERMNFLHLDWQQLVIVIFTLPLLIISLISLFVTRQLGKHRIKVKKREGIIPESVKYDGKPAFCLHVILFLFLLQELLYWLMPNYMFLRALMKLIIGVLTGYLALLGYRKQPTAISRFIVITLMIFTVADVVINYSFGIAILIFAVGEVVLGYQFYKYEKPAIWQLILWGASAAVCIVLIILNRSLVKTVIVQMIIYAIILMGFLAMSLNTPKKMRLSVFLLVIANIFIFFNTMGTRNLIVHVLGLGIYYLSMGILAMSTRFRAVIIKEKSEPDVPIQPLKTEQAA